MFKCIFFSQEICHFVARLQGATNKKTPWLLPDYTNLQNNLSHYLTSICPTPSSTDHARLDPVTAHHQLAVAQGDGEHLRLLQDWGDYDRAWDCGAPTSYF